MYQYQVASRPDEVNCNVRNVGIKQWIKTRRQPENLSALLIALNFISYVVVWIKYTS